ncbi:hypothetical protein [Streptomyces sp. NPDC127084]|uniref:hypothetical protein n=1 Tax=Streptomyces sp. NPDC127084 TaxID=3347133 RepID=UPI0036470195
MNRFQNHGDQDTQATSARSIRPSGAGFQVWVYAGRDPLTKKGIYLHRQGEMEPEAEKVRTRLLHQVDEKRHPKQQVTTGSSSTAGSASLSRSAGSRSYGWRSATQPS